MKAINRVLSYIFFLGIMATLSNCGPDAPQKEDVPEVITTAKLTFTPSTGSAIVVTATDPDADGVQSIKVDGPINLLKNTEYVLSITLLNELAKPTDDAYEVSKEVLAEGDEHMFFFSWTKSAFANPSGDGNIDSRNDPVRYVGGTGSLDGGNLPLGLTTTWLTTDVVTASANFRVLLKHQPALKSATSSSNDGETDLDITFVLNVN